MTRPLLSTLACACLALASGPAGAAASASATLSQLTVSLYDLIPTDDIAPGITFDAGYGSLSVSIVQSGDLFHDYDGRYTGAPFADVASAAGGAGDQASGWISGALTAGGGQAGAAASATMDGDYASGQAVFGDQEAAFTLNPGTLLVVTAAASISGTTDPGFGNWAMALASLELQGVLGDSTQTSAANLALELGDNGVSGPHAASGAQAGYFYVALADPSPTAYETGTVHGYVEADATSGASASHVPEPGGLLLLGAGLVAMAASRRQRGPR